MSINNNLHQCVRNLSDLQLYVQNLGILSLLLFSNSFMVNDASLF